MRTKPNWFAVILAGLAAVTILILVLTGVISQPSYYADGELVDATGAIVLEEDGDPSELGMRIIMLASGSDRFTQEQRDQITELFSGLCESIRDNAMKIEMLEQKVERLQETLNQKEE